MSSSSAPRIYCIPATAAPVLAVFRRGPSEWWHVGRWDVGAPSYEPGAWFRGRLYPRRCDVSPDGRWLAYFALKAGATWDVGDTYCAISRLPWLTALAAWSTCGTWTRGFHFAEGEDRVWQIGEPDRGDAGAFRRRYGMRAVEPVQFCVERRRGWRETSESPQRDAGDLWDQRRNAELSRRQPGGDVALFARSEGWPGGEWGGEAIEGLKVSYWLEAGGDLWPLDDVQWADWDEQGRLLVATRAGKLQIRRQRGSEAELVFEHDLGRVAPAPGPAPAWAQQP